MQLDELRAYLQPRTGLDVPAAFARFRQSTGSDDMDRFLTWLREQDLITHELFGELHASDAIAVARLVGVRKNKTLILEQPGKPQGIQGLPNPPMATPAPMAASASDTPTIADPSQTPTVATPAAPRSSPQPVVEDEGPGDSSGYMLLGLLAQGGMGAVYVARDLELLRKVAFKHLLPEHRGNAVMNARFFGEVQITAQLDHPNIVPIYELEVGPDGVLGYAMKLIQGRTFAAIVKESRERAMDGNQRAEQKRLAKRLDSFLKVCDAISYAHSKGVLHRDLKPDNIMLGRYREVYVMDWGICRLMGSTEPEPDEGRVVTDVTVHDKPLQGSTQHGTILGTPAYMSPEQAQGRVPDLDARSDLYALGLILFELVSLRQAVTGESMQRVLFRASQGEKDPLVHFHPRLRIPRELRAIIGKATAREPAARYATVKDFADDLRAFLRNDSVAAQPDNVIQRAARYIGRHKLASLVAIAFMALATALVIIFMLLNQEKTMRAARLHEERTQAFILAVSQQSHALDSHFYRYEKAIAKLSGRVHEVLARADLEDAAVYTSKDFDTPDLAPPDLAPSAYYGQAVSLEHPVITVAPGVDRAGVADEMERLAHLGPGFKEVMLDSTGVARATVAGDRARVRELIAVTGVPALRTFATLASGVHASYPGMGGYPDDYDGRKRPKYALSANRHGIVWGNPFPDRYGHGLILAASMSLYDAQGQFLGVTGLEMTFEWIIQNLVVMRDAPYLEGSYLVDGEGRVVIQAGRQGAVAAPAQAAMNKDAAELRKASDSETVALEPLPYPGVLRELDKKMAGHEVIQVKGKAKLAVFYPIDSLDWWYVVIADEEELMGQAGARLDGPNFSAFQ